MWLRRWVRYVLVWTAGPLRPRNAMVAIDGADGLRGVAGKVHLELSADPVVVTVIAGTGRLADGQ